MRTVSLPVDRRWAPLGHPRTPTGTELVYGDEVDANWRVVDLDGSGSSTVHRPQGYSYAQYRRWQASPFFGDPALLGSGRVIFSVVPKNGAAPAKLYALPSSLTGVATPLTGSPPYFAARRPDAVWVAAGPVRRRLVELDADTGRALARSGRLPGKGMPIAELPSGFLVETSNNDATMDRLEIRAVATGRLVRTLATTVASYGGLLAVSPQLIAWHENGCVRCAIHLTRTSDGLDRLVEPPPAFGGACLTGAFSPDVRRLALLAGCPRRGFQDGLAIILASSGRSRFVRRTHNTAEGPYWGARGDWVFWAGQADAHGNVATLAYHLGASAPVRFASGGSAPLLLAIPTP